MIDDRELAGEAARGDEAAFELIVRRHSEVVWKVARAVLHDDAMAEDAAQETFLRAYRSLSGFRGESSLRTWLVSICHRTCQEGRRRRRHPVVSLDEARHRQAAEETTDLRIVIEHALARLPEDERVAFTLVDVLGHTREEAATIVGVPASTMRSRVGRARRRVVEAVRCDETEAEAEGAR